MSRYVLLFSGWLLLGAGFVSAQASLMGGVSYSTVRSQYLVGKKQGAVCWQAGFAFLYRFDSTARFGLKGEFIIEKKGYRQIIDKRYDFGFDYMSLPVLLNFTPNENYSLSGGLSFGRLFGTSVRQGLDTYRLYELGFVVEVNLFEKNRFGIYTRMNQDLTPMIHYYSLDELGNITGTIRDLKITDVVLGLRIRIPQ